MTASASSGALRRKSVLKPRVRRRIRGARASGEEDTLSAACRLLESSSRCYVPASEAVRSQGG